MNKKQTRDMVNNLVVARGDRSRKMGKIEEGD